MIKKFLLFFLSFIILSGCNLAISLLDSTVTDEEVPESTAVPTPEPQEPTTEPTEEPTSESTTEPTEEPTIETTAEPTPEPTQEPPEPTAVTDPLVLNGDFEKGDTTGWTGQLVVNTPSAHTGAYGARISTASSISQNITGLTPDTDYLLSLYTKFENMPGSGCVIIQDYWDEYIEIPMYNENTDWNFNTISFTTCNSSTEVTISLYCNLANVCVDDIILEVAGVD